MTSSDEGEPVQLYIYDLSRGLAKQFAPLVALQLDGIWHTSIVVGGQEIYYGGGIQTAVPGTTPHGQPVQIVELGRTEVPAELRQEFLLDLSDRYTPEKYSLLHNNCNNFSDELANLLVGHGIPAHITGLPSEVMASPFGQMLLPQLRQMEAELNSRHQHSTAITRQHPPPPAPHDAAEAASPGAVTQAPASPQPIAPTPLPPASVRAAIAESMAAPPTSPPSATEAAESGKRIAQALSEGAVEGADKPRSAAATTADTAGTGVHASEASTSASPAAAQPSSPGIQQAREAFAAAIREEFNCITAAGNVGPNEAAVMALQRVRAAHASGGLRAQA